MLRFLFESDLIGREAIVDLREVNLSRANLSGARLTSPFVAAEQLAQAASLKGAILPGGTVHE